MRVSTGLIFVLAALCASLLARVGADDSWDDDEDAESTPQVTGCVATANHDGSVTVKWDPLGDGFEYVILGQREGQPATTISPDIEGEDEYIIRNEKLVSGAFYTFQVKAKNQQGSEGPLSEVSSEIMVRLPPDSRQGPHTGPEHDDEHPKPEKVDDVEASLEDNGVKVTWEALKNSDRVSHYVILGTRKGQLRHAVSGRLISHEVLAAGDKDLSHAAHLIPLSRLVPGAEYTFQVAPINVHVHGPPSEPSTSVQLPGKFPSNPTPPDGPPASKPAPDRPESKPSFLPLDLL